MEGEVKMALRFNSPGTHLCRSLFGVGYSMSTSMEEHRTCHVWKEIGWGVRVGWRWRDG